MKKICLMLFATTPLLLFPMTTHAAAEKYTRNMMAAYWYPNGSFENSTMVVASMPIYPDSTTFWLYVQKDGHFIYGGNTPVEDLYVSPGFNKASLDTFIEGHGWIHLTWDIYRRNSVVYTSGSRDGVYQVKISDLVDPQTPYYATVSGTIFGDEYNDGYGNGWTVFEIIR